RAQLLEVGAHDPADHHIRAIVEGSSSVDRRVLICRTGSRDNKRNGQRGLVFNHVSLTSGHSREAIATGAGTGKDNLNWIAAGSCVLTGVVGAGRGGHRSATRSHS